MSTATKPAITPDFAAQYRDMLAQTLDFEFPVTKKVIEAVPSSNNGYKPDEKSKTADVLAFHVAQSTIWFLDSVASLKFEWKQDPNEKIPTPVDTAAWWAKEYPRAIARVKAMTGEQLTTIIDFFGMKLPAVNYLMFAHSHCVHHRGQLSTYLRAMGGKCPSIYGGSADEPFKG